MKNRNRIIIIISSILLSCRLLFIIKLNEGLMGIKTDWENTFRSKKQFFKSCSFSGKVIRKTFNEKTNQSYSLTIILDLNTVIPEWGERAFYQYYEFDQEKKILKFLVSEYVYKNTIKNDIIIKKEGSNAIFINDRTYDLLSDESLKWTP